jgi:DNA-binding FrmR family transcriptional regulator
MRSDPNPREDIAQRMHCAAGHLQAVIEMTEAGAPCEQVLHQLNAVRAALHMVGVKIIECQAQSSQDVILNCASVEKRVDALHHLQSLYAIFVRQYSSRNEVTYE